MMDLVKDGKLRAVIDSIYELKDAAEAFRRLESGRVTGKVVLRNIPQETITVLTSEGTEDA